jgi:hypothetical protein
MPTEPTANTNRPHSQTTVSAPNKRLFFLDFIASVALLVGAFVGAKGLARLHPILGLFFFIVVAGLGWYYFRVAWRELRRGREGRR